MSTIYICNRCGEMMSRIYTSFTFDYFKGKPNRACQIFDICKECHEEFEKFMKPTKDESSTVKLRPWSEVGAPPKINGQPLSANDDSDSDTFVKNPSKVTLCVGCEQCEFDSTSIDEEPCASCGGTSNFKPKGFYDACEQCKFKDFSWDEEPCSTCKYSAMSIGDDPSDNFESKEEEDSRYSTDVDAALSKAKYKIGSYIRSDIIKDQIYKIMGIRLRDDGEIFYTVEDVSADIKNLIWERVIDNWYTVIVKYSCDGCKLEGTDDCMCDTCIVGDPKGPRRQWWKPKEEG